MAGEQPKRSHRLVEEYDGIVGFGLDRETDEVSLGVYLQMFSDDEFLKIILPRLTDGEINELFELLSLLIMRHVDKEEEYHQVFLKDG